MKNLMFVLMVAFSIVTVVEATPGPEIPVPSPTIEKAIAAADTYYRQTYIANFGARKKWHEEFIMDSAVYKNTGHGNWNWLVTFRHPRGNDVSVTFKINRNGTVEPIPFSVTE